MVSRLVAAYLKISTNIRVCTLFNVYQVMYICKKNAHYCIFNYFEINTYFFTSLLFARRNCWHFKMNSFVKHRAQNDRRDDIRTILNKSEFLLGTQAVSGLKD